LPDDRISLLEPDHSKLSLRKQCELLAVNRSNFYYAKKDSAAISDDKLSLLRLVDEIYTKYPFFGTRQMADYLRLQGRKEIKRHHTRWAFEKLGLRSIAPCPNTSKAHPQHKLYPYLLRGFKVTRPNQVWSTDLTFIRLYKGFVYLMAIIDWYSRYVLDWALSITMEADFCIDTLNRVLATGTCDIFNTDQGAQFTSNGFTGLLEAHKIQISMDGKGRALDNIFVERLWRTVKYECVYLQEWDSVREAKIGLQKYFNFYNYERPHSSLGGKTPFMAHKMLAYGHLN